jgi:hypothetical protein
MSDIPQLSGNKLQETRQTRVLNATDLSQHARGYEKNRMPVRETEDEEDEKVAACKHRNSLSPRPRADPQRDGASAIDGARVLVRIQGSLLLAFLFQRQSFLPPVKLHQEIGLPC